jgi:hypothetical protein
MKVWVWGRLIQRNVNWIEYFITKDKD